jgi:hypothetical protein
MVFLYDKSPSAVSERGRYLLYFAGAIQAPLSTKGLKRNCGSIIVSHSTIICVMLQILQVFDHSSFIREITGSWKPGNRYCYCFLWYLVELMLNCVFALVRVVRDPSPMILQNQSNYD